MAACRSGHGSADSEDAADVSGWTNGKDSDSQQKRCVIMRNIKINQQGLSELRSILGSGWDVNELLNLYDHDLYNIRCEPLDLLSYLIEKSCDNEYLLEIVRLLLENGANPNLTHMVELEMTGGTRWVHWTALHEAAHQGWTEGVKILLDAGAECTTSDELQNPLTVALKGHDCSPNLIKLLFKHGADPNNHDDDIENIPLLNAIRKNEAVNLQLLLAHGANPNVTHRVNIGGCGEAKWVHQTALQEALALQKKTWQPDIAKLLLKHGADPNDHDDQLKNIPLLNAIVNLNYAERDTKIVQLLLEHGANPNVAYKVYVYMGESKKCIHMFALYEAFRRDLPEVMEMLLDAGAKCTALGPLAKMRFIEVYQSSPRLISLLLKYSAEKRCLLQKLSLCIFQGNYRFPQLLLDCLFLHGGDINEEDCYHRTVVERPIIIEYGHSNMVRWLIRHGAASLPTFTMLKRCIVISRGTWFPDMPLILLRAGLRVSRGVQTQLSNMEVTISTWLQVNPLGEVNVDIYRKIESGWDQLVAAGWKDLQTRRHYRKKSSFPEYWTKQMADLQEFSDESLQVYPEDSPIEEPCPQYQKTLDQIHRVLEFLSQPQSLEWYCRRCVRENLMSLQPSVVKTLPGPSRLKRYILCHEI